MEWWVRCGNCFSSTAPLTSTSVFLTSCGHFVCNHCLTSSPLPKPRSTGYCYDCKKPCSVVNLSQRDKLSPDIAFYFKDPSSLFQKIIEIDNFQKIHRKRRVEVAIKRQLTEDIVTVKQIRKKSEKYLPYLEWIYNVLCSKYGPPPTNQHIDLRPAEIGEFIKELMEIERKRGCNVTPLNVVSDTDGNVMEVDQRTPSQSSHTTHLQQGASLSSGSKDKTMLTNKNPGVQSSLFRAHVQSEMRGDGVVQYSTKTTPTGNIQNKPSPLFNTTRSALQVPTLPHQQTTSQRSHQYLQKANQQNNLHASPIQHMTPQNHNQYAPFHNVSKHLSMSSPSMPSSVPQRHLPVSGSMPAPFMPQRLPVSTLVSTPVPPQYSGPMPMTSTVPPNHLPVSRPLQVTTIHPQNLRASNSRSLLLSQHSIPHRLPQTLSLSQHSVVPQHASVSHPVSAPSCPTVVMQTPVGPFRGAGTMLSSVRRMPLGARH